MNEERFVFMCMVIFILLGILLGLGLGAGFWLVSGSLRAAQECEQQMSRSTCVYTLR